MSFSALLTNEFVSDVNLQDAVNTSVFTLKNGQTIPTGTRIVTKQNALAYLNIDSSNTYLTAKTNIQLIAKRDLTPIANSNPDPATAILTFESYSNGLFGFRLSAAIPSTNIVITQATVDGSTFPNCGGNSYGDVDNYHYSESDTITSNNVLRINKGNTSGTQLGNTRMSCSVQSWIMIDSIIVNGVVASNNNVITIGGTSVTISIDPYCIIGYNC